MQKGQDVEHFRSTICLLWKCWYHKTIFQTEIIHYILKPWFIHLLLNHFLYYLLQVVLKAWNSVMELMWNILTGNTCVIVGKWTFFFYDKTRYWSFKPSKKDRRSNSVASYRIIPVELRDPEAYKKLVYGYKDELFSTPFRTVRQHFSMFVFTSGKLVTLRWMKEWENIKPPEGI